MLKNVMYRNFFIHLKSQNCLISGGLCKSLDCRSHLMAKRGPKLKQTTYHEIKYMENLISKEIEFPVDPSTLGD